MNETLGVILFFNSNVALMNHMLLLLVSAPSIAAPVTSPVSIPSIH